MVVCLTIKRSKHINNCQNHWEIGSTSKVKRSFLPFFWINLLISRIKDKMMSVKWSVRCSLLYKLEDLTTLRSISPSPGGLDTFFRLRLRSHVRYAFGHQFPVRMKDNDGDRAMSVVSQRRLDFCQKFGDFAKKKGRFGQKIPHGLNWAKKNGFSLSGWWLWHKVGQIYCQMIGRILPKENYNISRRLVILPNYKLDFARRQVKNFGPKVPLLLHRQLLGPSLNRFALLSIALPFPGICLSFLSFQAPEVEMSARRNNPTLLVRPTLRRVG